MSNGQVYFIGAGPGDEGLITAKGIRALEHADAVLYDRLVNPKLLLYARPTAEFIYVGKFPKHHTLRQELIQEEIIRYAKNNQTVVRLKGGDPGVFGRVGEETQALDKAGIAYDVVPGITAGIAAPLYAGVPVTHRDYGASFAIAAGHRKKESEDELDWQSLAGIETIAFYMGVNNLQQITDQLLAHGRSHDEPALIIEWGTTGRQRTVQASLATLALTAKEASISNPAITLVGRVNHVYESKSWWERKNGFGQSYIVAYDEHYNEGIQQELLETGANVLVYPHVASIAKPSPKHNWHKVTSICFEDAQAVRHWMAWLRECNEDIRQLRAELIVRTERAAKQLEQFGLSSIQNDTREAEISLSSQPGTEQLVTTTHTYHPISHDCLVKQFESGERQTIHFPTVESVSFFVDALRQGGIEWVADQIDAICLDHEVEQAVKPYFMMKEEEHECDLVRRSWQSGESRGQSVRAVYS
ncbi:uroporphyrinogen-III C-methyltransferase [Geomicrobium sp. JCM 19038]|uniref:uroporphyrinogen-III C-methyltransferase n=1 Tax=Geomicrobium sp. JCM 19038 TaxID=1460635 RepID=UPI000693912C|nr:uroporphyrinogen-III C-methyltransferase [Geomicrobium sp. JCM 19038]